MNDVAARPFAASRDDAADRCLVFAIAGEHFGLPLTEVEGIAAPPALTAVPHAPPALLGAGNLGGQIVPVIDVAAVLHPATAGTRHYDGHGEILRLRTAAGGVGLWVDRVEYLAGTAADSETASFELLDPEALLAEGLMPPILAGIEFGSGETLDDSHAESSRVAIAPPVVAREAAVLVEVAGKAVALRQQDVVELLEHVPWTPLPCAPQALLGIGMLRGSALPVLSLAELLGLAASGPANGFALVEFSTGRGLLAVDRVVGLRAGVEHTPIDVHGLISQEWQEIITGFQTQEITKTAPVALAEAGRSDYLSFSLGGRQFGLPVSAIERVVEPVPLIRLPRTADDDEFLSDTAGAIELRGRIIPVAAIHRRLGIAVDEAKEPVAYLILHLAGGSGAIGVDRIGTLISLSPEDIAAPPGEAELICGVAALGGVEPLSILAPEHLWRQF